jgi:hypothetical protein
MKDAEALAPRALLSVTFVATVLAAASHPARGGDGRLQWHPALPPAESEAVSLPEDQGPPIRPLASVSVDISLGRDDLWSDGLWAPGTCGPRGRFDQDQDQVEALEIFRDELVACGEFGFMDGAPVPRIAAWNDPQSISEWAKPPPPRGAASVTPWPGRSILPDDYNPRCSLSLGRRNPGQIHARRDGVACVVPCIPEQIVSPGVQGLAP